MKGSLGGVYTICEHGHVNSAVPYRAFCISPMNYFYHPNFLQTNALTLAYLIKMDEALFLAVANTSYTTASPHVNARKQRIEERR